LVSWKDLEALLSQLAAEPRLLEAAERAGVVVVRGSLIQTVPALISRRQRTAVSRSRV
jgi:hypothetical protein